MISYFNEHNGELVVYLAEQYLHVPTGWASSLSATTPSFAPED